MIKMDIFRVLAVTVIIMFSAVLAGQAFYMACGSAPAQTELPASQDADVEQAWDDTRKAAEQIGNSTPPKDLAEYVDRLATMKDGTPVHMLFVINVNKGTILKVGDAKRTLTFNQSDVTTAMGFTDRPERYAFNMTTSMIASMWGEGENSFAADPPNAVVEDSRSRLGITEVTGFAIVDDLVTIQLDRMSYKSLDSGDSLDGDVEDLTLFIDSKAFKITGAGIAFGLQQAAKACVSVDCEFWPLGA